MAELSQKEALARANGLPDTQTHTTGSRSLALVIPFRRLLLELLLLLPLPLLPFSDELEDIACKDDFESEISMVNTEHISMVY